MTKNKRTTRSFLLRAPHIVLITGIILIAANLRPAITSVGPLLESLRSDIGLSHGLAGLITTLPLIAFAIFSPLAPKMSHRFGNEKIMFLGLVMLAVGISVRTTASAAVLFIGTFIIGIAIAICNVLLPGLIKQKFSGKVGLMTGMYSTVMNTFAALGSGLSVPLAKGLGLGWRGALTCWAVWAVIAAIVWLPLLHRRVEAVKRYRAMSNTGTLWRSPLAWQVTFFMGLQSLIFYVTITWLPDILHDRGLSVATAGWMVSFMQFAGLPATFLVPVLADRRPNQKAVVVIIGILYITGLAGLFSDSTALVILWIILLGLSQGASISLSLAFLGLRARNAQQAAELSGMAQSVGYLLAGVGPVLFGYLHDFTHTWTIPLIMLIIVSILMLFAGLGAGRAAYITPDADAE